MQSATRACIAILGSTFSFPLFAPALTITAPGFYKLGEDISYASTPGDSIISIQTSGVVLDLGDNSIVQIGANVADGIAIASGLDQITIRNGRIASVGNRAIFVDTTLNADSIVIEDITIDTCRGRAISFEGAGGSTNCFIENCSIIDCSGLSGIFFSDAGNTHELSNIEITFRTGAPISTNFSGIVATGSLTSSIINNVTLSNVSSGSTSLIGINIGSATALRIENFSVQNCPTLTSFIGIAATSCDSCAIQNITYERVLPTGSFTGIAITTASQSSIEGLTIQGVTNTNFIGVSTTSFNGSSLSDSIVQGLSSSGACTFFNSSGASSGSSFNNIIVQGAVCSGAYTCFSFPATANKCLFNACRSLNITASSASHISLTGASTATICIDCSAQGITTGGAITAFIVPSGTATRLLFIDCLVEGCASTGNCSPYSFVGCTDCTLIRCYALGNTSTGSAAQYNGFTFDSTSTSCVLRDCVSSLNSATGASSASRGYFLNGTTNCVLHANEASRNTGVSASVGFTQGSATNAFILNIAIKNGTTVANQFSSFVGTQANTVALASVNSITQPYTNAGIV